MLELLEENGQAKARLQQDHKLLPTLAQMLHLSHPQQHHSQQRSKPIRAD